MKKFLDYTVIHVCACMCVCITLLLIIDFISIPPSGNEGVFYVL